MQGAAAVHSCTVWQILSHFEQKINSKMSCHIGSAPGPVT